MNLSLRDIRAASCWYRNFTLAADTPKGTRPGFSTGSRTEDARKLFAHLLERAKAAHTARGGGLYLARTCR